MRLIAGKQRGIKLSPLRGWAIRPTPGRVRESLFNVIGERIVGSSFLDLFAGSGAVGMEALSRGASRVLMIDCSRQAIAVIRKNLIRCQFSRGVELWCGDSLAFLNRLVKKGEQFAFIYVDPPYDSGLAKESLQLIAASTVLSPQGMVVVEHSSRGRGLPAYPPLAPFKTKVFGDTALSFLGLGEVKSPLVAGNRYMGKSAVGEWQG